MNWLAYMLVLHTPLWRWNRLLPHAMDWAYRNDHKAMKP